MGCSSSAPQAEQTKIVKKITEVEEEIETPADGYLKSSEAVIIGLLNAHLDHKSSVCLPTDTLNGFARTFFFGTKNRCSIY
jgi:hypothetical protein